MRPAQRNLLRPQSYDAATGRIINVNNTFGDERAVGFHAILQFQVQPGLQYSFQVSMQKFLAVLQLSPPAAEAAATRAQSPPARAEPRLARGLAAEGRLRAVVALHAARAPDYGSGFSRRSQGWRQWYEVVHSFSDSGFRELQPRPAAGSGAGGGA